MHIVTKFLIVLAAVLAVLLSGLSIAYTANADRVVAEYRALQDRIAGLEASHAADKAQLTALRDDALRQLSAKDTELARLRGQADSLARERDTLRSENAQLRLSEGIYQNQIDEFIATMATYAQLDEKQSAELAELRQAVLESGRKELDMFNTIADLQTENEVLGETNQALQVQIVQLQQQLEGAGTVVSANGQSGPRRVPPGFMGRVTDVRSDATGRVLVAIDAGTSDQLGEEMKLMVVRGGQFIGNLVLQRVDVNEAVGLFQDLTGRQVQAGDVVRPAI